MMDGTKVFINCPFDDGYFPLLKSMLFTVLYCGHHPQISETRDSSQTRIDQLTGLLRDSDFSIHDLSRVDPVKKGELPRFNMPFELGLDIGSKIFGVLNKKILILEKERYRYQKFLSDIAGQDIKSHGGKAIKLVKQVRDWFYIHSERKEVANYTEIWSVYNEFLYEYQTDLLAMGLHPDRIGEIPFAQMIELMQSWIEARKLKDPQLSIRFKK